MSWEVVAIVLTIIGLLSSLAVTMIALFFRVGAFKGETTTHLEHQTDALRVFREENTHQHQQITDRLTAHHGRLSAIETQIPSKGGGDDI